MLKKHEDFCVSPKSLGPYSKASAEALLEEHLEVAYGIKHEKRHVLKCSGCGVKKLAAYWTSDAEVMEDAATPEYVWYVGKEAVLCPECYAEVVAEIVVEHFEMKERAKHGEKDHG